jgi:hypothetical protein
VIFGAVIDETMGEDIRITVIATGFEDRERKVTLPDNIESGIEYTAKKNYFPTKAIFTKKKFTPPQNQNVENMNVDEDVNIVSNTNIFTSKSINPSEKSNTGSTQPLPAKDMDDDIEIPAFIRKKMGMQ